MPDKPSPPTISRILPGGEGDSLSSALDRLQVIDCLEVGPVRLQPKRLTAPYRVFQDGRQESFDLIYTYAEPVFDPDDPGSRNLAAVIAAQVALNYGLFCREIRLHGPFDTLDRRLIKTMAENTAKEIYVNKILASNPFLIEAF